MLKCAVSIHIIHLIVQFLVLIIFSVCLISSFEMRLARASFRFLSICKPYFKRNNVHINSELLESTSNCLLLLVWTKLTKWCCMSRRVIVSIQVKTFPYPKVVRGTFTYNTSLVQYQHFISNFDWDAKSVPWLSFFPLKEFLPEVEYYIKGRVSLHSFLLFITIIWYIYSLSMHEVFLLFFLLICILPFYWL